MVPPDSGEEKKGTHGKQDCSQQIARCSEIFEGGITGMITFCSPIATYFDHMVPGDDEIEQGAAKEGPCSEFCIFSKAGKKQDATDYKRQPAQLA